MIFWCAACVLIMSGCSKAAQPEARTGSPREGAPQEDPRGVVVAAPEEGLEQATFAGGCFWCTDAAFEDLDGVKKIVSGFSGGHVRNPSYVQVSSGSTGHLESIQITFDPKVISYAELLEVYWKQFDPTDDGGSFVDRGSEYLSAVFYHDELQKAIAEQSKDFLDRTGLFGKPIVTKILKFEAFYPAEDYHQHYCKISAAGYHGYREASGRDEFIQRIWGNLLWKTFQKPSEDEVRAKLNSLQFDVTQRSGTERPFNNAFWNNEKEGFYVDIVSGEPLFSSKDKFDSGTGWPSFTKAIDPRCVVKKSDRSLIEERVEVRSRYADSHLGHLFDDGPAPGHLRYCMNSASLRFIPQEEMQKEGYGNFLWLLK